MVSSEAGAPARYASDERTVTVSTVRSDVEGTGVGSDRRASLLAAIEPVLREEGPEASMTALAAGAGITKPVLYRHFGDKQALLAAWAEQQAAPGYCKESLALSMSPLLSACLRLQAAYRAKRARRGSIATRAAWNVGTRRM